METHNQRSVARVKRATRYIYICSIKFGMLDVRENAISLRKLSGATAQLHALEGALFSNIDAADALHE